MIKRGDTVEVRFRGTVVKGNEISNYITVCQLAGQFGLPYGDTVTIHFENVTIVDEEERLREP